METFTSSESPLSQQFCTFCLREKLPDAEFYKHIVGCSVEQQKWLQIILRYDFRLQNFAICEPCWEIMQLIQDFRLRCLMANSLVEHIGAGLRREDGWFSVRNLATIERIRMAVKDQLLQMEKVKFRLEVSKESEGDQQQKQSETEEAPEAVLISTLDIGEVKVELNGVDSDQETNLSVEHKNTSEDMPMVPINNVQIKTDPDAYRNIASEQPSNTKTNEMVTESNDKQSIDESEANYIQINQMVNIDSSEEVLESTIDIGEVKIEPELEDKEQPSSIQSDIMETESDDESVDQSSTSNQVDTPGLLQCKKCSRIFHPKGYKVHTLICDGTIPFRIYKCQHCPITFKHLYLFNNHMNKHLGKTPYKCSNHCKKEFFSARALNQHEIKYGKDFIKCTLCDKMIENQKLLHDHYNQAHPGAWGFPCSKCDKRFTERRNLTRHEKTHTPEGPVKLTCKECGKSIVNKYNMKLHMVRSHSKEMPFQCEQCSKSFAERLDLKRHMATAHSEREVFQCEHCDRQFKLKVSLEIHVASKHPELASERAKKSLARWQDRLRVRSSKRKLEPKGRKNMRSKPKKKEADP